MALRIIKLALEAPQTISTTPLVMRYFHEVPNSVKGLGTYKIGVEDFLDDTGEVAEELPLLNLNNNYFHVFINGVLQMDDNFSYTAGKQGIGSLIISIPEDSEISVGSPVILEIVNFFPEITGD